MGTNNCAELPAMLDVLLLCKAVEIVNLVVKCDSSLMVSWLKNISCTLWYLWIIEMKF